MGKKINEVQDRVIKNFTDLEAWKVCRDVRLFISNLVKKFPPEEKYRLVDDMIRASRSTTHNIAEGYGRFHYKENAQFCRQSRGSLYELIDQLITCRDDGLISEEEFQEGTSLIKKSITILNGYINYLVRAKSRNKINNG